LQRLQISPLIDAPRQSNFRLRASFFVAHYRQCRDTKFSSRLSRYRPASRLGQLYSRRLFSTPLLSRFTINCPNVEVVLIEAERPEIEQALSNGQADLAVMLISNRRQERLVTQALISSPRKLWLGSNHSLLTRSKISLHDIAAEPYIMLGVDEAEATSLAYWRRANVTPNIYFKTSALEAVRGMVAAGLGVTILADTVYRPWSLEGRRIETRDIVEYVPSLDIGLAWNPDHPLPPAAESFPTFLTTSCHGEVFRR
jgi:DNA-binding transcriptional LysR family regulator